MGVARAAQLGFHSQCFRFKSTAGLMNSLNLWGHSLLHHIANSEDFIHGEVRKGPLQSAGATESLQLKWADGGALGGHVQHSTKREFARAATEGFFCGNARQIGRVVLLGEVR